MFEPQPSDGLSTVALIGEPATGKSTIMRRVIDRLREKSKGVRSFEASLLRGYVFDRTPPVVLFGVYGEGTFGGTDRLSMGVPPEYVSLVKNYDEYGLGGHVLLWEGDRFTTNGILSASAEGDRDLHLFHVTTDRAWLKDRREQRQQDAAWLKGRRSKVLRAAERHDATPLRHTTPDDTERAVETVLETLGGV
jgi:GTPase SAR1 family protein